MFRYMIELYPNGYYTGGIVHIVRYMNRSTPWQGTKAFLEVLRAYTPKGTWTAAYEHSVAFDVYSALCNGRSTHVDINGMSIAIDWE